MKNIDIRNLRCIKNPEGTHEHFVEIVVPSVEEIRTVIFCSGAGNIIRKHYASTCGSVQEAEECAMMSLIHPAIIIRDMMLSRKDKK